MVPKSWPGGRDRDPCPAPAAPLSARAVVPLALPPMTRRRASRRRHRRRDDRAREQRDDHRQTDSPSPTHGGDCKRPPAEEVASVVLTDRGGRCTHDGGWFSSRFRSQGRVGRAVGRGTPSHPEAGRAAHARAAEPGVRPDPQPADLGSRAYRQLRGALARPADRRPRAAARRSRRALRRDRAAAQDPRRAADPARGRGPSLHGRGARADPRGARRDRAGPGGPVARRRLRLRDAARARVPAQRDDAAAPADGRVLRAGGGRRRARGRAGLRRAGDGPGRGRRPRDRRGAEGLRLRQRAPAAPGRRRAPS